MGEQAVRCVRGMKDLLPADSRIFTAIEGEMRRVFGSFGFCEIRTPLVEETRLFSRGIGEETDIVSKEMYTFPDRDGSLLTLRPEGTASAVRAYIEHSFDRSDPVQRWYYTGAMFRHERPQKGRYRQFHQIGAESFGVADPFADAELIHMLLVFMAALKVAGVALRINSLGCPVCRPAFREKLRTFMESRAAELCDDCKRRIVTNPLRVLDCKQERCIAATAGAPASSENLCQECAVHFTGVQNALAAFGDTWSVDNRMVRGLDYYNRTTFELLATDPEAGAQNAVAGGGRYDALVEMLGGRATPAVGFAIGLERLRMLVAGAGDPALPAVSVFILAGSRATIREAATLASVLRGRGIPVELDGTDRGFKAKFKRADKSGARIAVIIGEDEAARGTCAVKSMTSAMLPGGEKQAEIALGAAADFVQGTLNVL